MALNAVLKEMLKNKKYAIPDEWASAGRTEPDVTDIARAVTEVYAGGVARMISSARRDSPQG